MAFVERDDENANLHAMGWKAVGAGKELSYVQRGIDE